VPAPSSAAQPDALHAARKAPDAELLDALVHRLADAVAARVLERLRAEPGDRSFVSVRHVAERLDCSKPHVFYLIEAGLLDGFVVGKLTRVSRASLDRYCANAKVWERGSGRGGNRRKADEGEP
jgi:excisionase family DNA binding protein